MGAFAKQHGLTIHVYSAAHGSAVAEHTTIGDGAEQMSILHQYGKDGRGHYRPFVQDNYHGEEEEEEEEDEEDEEEHD
jgi:hypothetical protein